MSLLVIGVVVVYRPEESRKLASETAARITTAAGDLWRAAGWQEVSKPISNSTRGYRAPQRFIKPSEPATSIVQSRTSEAAPAAYDEKASETAPFGGDESQRPQVAVPALAGPENGAKLKQLDTGAAPKLQPANPRATNETGAGSSTRRDGQASSKLNAPDIRTVRNPFAQRTADDGTSESRNEPALLKAEGDEEAPIGSGLAAQKGAQTTNEKSVLKSPSRKSTTPAQPTEVVAPEESKAEASPPAKSAEKARRPFTAILSDAAPTVVPDTEDEKKPLNESKIAAPSKVASPEPLLSKPVELLDHHASNFQGLTPGDTNETALLAALGAPTSTTNDADVKTMRFASETFKEIAVTVQNRIVESITLMLHKPLPTKEIVKELGLSAFEPGLVTTADGYVMGQVYPERGVILEFAKAENGVAEVERISLDRVSAEPFLLRALDDKNHRYTSNLRDLEVALRLDPKEPRAHWLKANLLHETGQHLSALRAIEEAIRLDTIAVGYRLTKAKILLALGRHGEASRIIDAALALKDLPPQAKMRALCQKGDLAACGPAPDYEKGMEFYQQAIQEASAFGDDARPAIRQLARRVLIESHLGVGRCVAWSQLAGATTASAKWNERARLLAETAIGDEDVSDDIWLCVNRSLMQTHLGLAAQSDPERDISDLQLDYKRMIRGVSDAAYRARIKWEFALALTDASRIQSARGKHRAAGQFADSAWSMMAEGIVGREDCEEDQFARGMLLYQLGSIAAVAKENHAKATEWYEQSIPLLEKPLAESLEAQTGLCGLALVGMGASYWETGDQKQAIALSEHGVKLLQQAADKGRASRESLDLAYGNLESMYRETGDSAAADRIAKRSAEQEKSTILR
jgi:tetratricopeptide (TPR) repeat protein